MRRKEVQLSILLLSLSGIIGLQAQDYHISFTGSGGSLTIDSVQVLNLTQGTTITLNNSDVLHLVKTITGIETQFAEKNNLLIYPNPSGEISKIEFYNSKTGQVIIEISDITGKIIFRKSQQLVEGSHTFRISGIISGIYIVNVYTPDCKFTGKFLSNFENSGNSSIEYLGSDFSTGKKYTLKSTQNLIQMQYNYGERILFKGISGNYSRVLTLIPTQDSTIIFDFIECTDADSNNYAVVTLGTQTWMAENLKTTHYSDNTAIPLVTGSDNWAALTETNEAYCWCDDDSAVFADTYGALYTWSACMNGAASSSSNPSGITGICPAGWHLPSKAEFTVLNQYLSDNGYGYQGSGTDIAKSLAATSGWAISFIPGTAGNDQLSNNSSAFTALPSGERDPNGNFYGVVGVYGEWWSATESNTTNAWEWVLINNNSNVLNFETSKKSGLSVRCVMDP